MIALRCMAWSLVLLVATATEECSVDDAEDCVAPRATAESFLQTRVKNDLGTTKVTVDLNASASDSEDEEPELSQVSSEQKQPKWICEWVPRGKHGCKENYKHINIFDNLTMEECAGACLMGVDTACRRNCNGTTSRKFCNAVVYFHEGHICTTYRGCRFEWGEELDGVEAYRRKCTKVE